MRLAVAFSSRIVHVASCSSRAIMLICPLSSSPARTIWKNITASLRRELHLGFLTRTQRGRARIRQCAAKWRSALTVLFCNAAGRVRYLLLVMRMSRPPACRCLAGMFRPDDRNNPAPRAANRMQRTKVWPCLGSCTKHGMASKWQHSTGEPGRYDGRLYSPVLLCPCGLAYTPKWAARLPQGLQVKMDEHCASRFEPPNRQSKPTGYHTSHRDCVFHCVHCG